jgi:chromosome segregation ATPase
MYKEIIQMPDKVTQNVDEQIADLTAENASLKGQIEELTRQLKQVEQLRDIRAKQYQNLLELYNILFEYAINHGISQAR